MKKLFTILCATLLSVGVFAQAQFGTTTGLNMSNVVGDGERQSHSKSLDG